MKNIKGYLTPFNRIVKVTEERVSMMGRKPRLQDLIDQIAIRSLVMKKQTINLEIAALRGVFRETKALEGVLQWPEGTERRSWLTTVDETDYRSFETLIASPRHIVFDRKHAAVHESAAALEANGHSFSGSELHEVLAGRRFEIGNRSLQKDQRHITLRDLKALDMDLSDCEPMGGILALAEQGEGGIMHGVMVRALLRLFANVIWLTGMRPKEVWQCSLMIPRSGLTVEEREMARIAPSIAITNRFLKPVSGESIQHLLASIDDPWEAMLREQAPCALMIKSAKQANANSLAGLAHRVQGLEGISSGNLRMLAMASAMKSLRISDDGQAMVRSAMTRHLKGIARENILLKDLNLNLYAFRHSFATRAKMLYPPEAAAAMTGHSAKKSLYRYGERFVSRTSKNRGGSAWMPSPDPIQTEALRQIWAVSDHEGPELSADR